MHVEDDRRVFLRRKVCLCLLRLLSVPFRWGLLPLFVLRLSLLTVTEVGSKSSQSPSLSSLPSSIVSSGVSHRHSGDRVSRRLQTTKRRRSGIYFSIHCPCYHTGNIIGYLRLSYCSLRSRICVMGPRGRWQNRPSPRSVLCCMSYFPHLFQLISTWHMLTKMFENRRS